MTAPQTATVKSAQRALAILELLIAREQRLTFGEIAQALGYPQSSLHGLLRTLVDPGWIEFDAKTRRYGLGIRTWEAGNAYLRSVELAERARPYMEQVRDALDETVQLAILDGRYNVYVAKVDGTQRLVLASEVGRRLEAHATGLGKVLLADLDRDELRNRIAGQSLEMFTEHTLTNLGDLEAELTRIRRQGYAEDREEYTLGVHCVAAPVRDHSGRTIAGMSVSVPTVRLAKLRQHHARDLLTRAATDLSAALGYRQPTQEAT